MRSIVRTSCARFMSHADCLAKTHPENIEAYLQSIDRQLYERILREEKAQLTFPLHFASQRQKLNFFAILHLLNFGSGYRVVLKAANGSGAFDNIIKLLIAAHLTHDVLDAAWMRGVTADEVASLMNISPIVEVPVAGNAALQQIKPSPAMALVTKIAEALNDTGSTLQTKQHDSLLDFVEASVAASPDVDALLTALSGLPVLNDTLVLADGTEVCLYKKMQVMVSELMRNGLDVPCIKKHDLTIFSDNVIPTMLNHFKLISCPDAESALNNDGELTPLQATSVRAASIVICEDIVRRAEELKLDWIGDEIDLDNYLWKVAKEADLRKLPRYAQRETWFY